MVLSGDAAPPAAALLGSASHGDTTLRNVEATRSDPMVMCARVRYVAMEQSAASARGCLSSCAKCCGFEPRQGRKPATVCLTVGGWLTQVHRAVLGATGSVGRPWLHMRACKHTQLPAARISNLKTRALSSCSSHGYVATHAPIHQVAPDKERESASTSTGHRISCGLTLCVLLHTQACANSGFVGAVEGAAYISTIDAPSACAPRRNHVAQARRR